MALFAAELGVTLPEPEDADDHDEEPPASPSASGSGKPRGRKALVRHLKRERIEHDLPESEKHCAHCDQDLRRIGEEVSERCEYLPAQMKVIEDACFTYACACRVKTATKPARPIEKSTAGASLLGQVIVSKWGIICPCIGRRKCSGGTASNCPIRRCAAGWRNVRSCSNLYMSSETARAELQGGGH